MYELPQKKSHGEYIVDAEVAQGKKSIFESTKKSRKETA